MTKNEGAGGDGSTDVRQNYMWSFTKGEGILFRRPITSCLYYAIRGEWFREHERHAFV
jgi:hypothetical protein